MNYNRCCIDRFEDREQLDRHSRVTLEGFLIGNNASNVDPLCRNNFHLTKNRLESGKSFSNVTKFISLPLPTSIGIKV